MFIDPLDSPNLLRKIDDNHVIDGFGNRYVLKPDPQGSPGGGWFLLLSILAALLLL